ncbi:MAG: glycosyltransferase [Lachnospiraceae bacterium]|nr:glycosyltransferase [Lachnospiraceae bacterium]
MESKVIAIVVTYNRKELLMECLTGILNQSVQVERIILIDNASTDGTEAELKKTGILERKNFVYRRMKQNLGGAGGFYKGIQTSLEFMCDWLWIMDDDTIPDRNCLENLLAASKIVNEKVSFFASSVNGSSNEPMNVPNLDIRATGNGYSDWYKYLEYGLVKIEMATFVSLLININAVKQCGLPCKDFFLWGDDSEYTLRLCRNYGNAYFVGKSKVCHKRAVAKKLSINDEIDTNRIKNYFYQYRNDIVIKIIYYGKIYFAWTFIRNLLCAVTAIRYPWGLRKSYTILKATFAGMYKYRYFKKYIQMQLDNHNSLG